MNKISKEPYLKIYEIDSELQDLDATIEKGQLRKIKLLQDRRLAFDELRNNRV